MEDNFRNALIILSAIIIAAIFIHGLWTIRKNKNPYKLKTKPTKLEPISRDFDGTGFDQDGVGQVKVKKATALTGEIDNPPADEEIPHQPAPAPEFSVDPIPRDVSDAKVTGLEETEVTDTKPMDIPEPTSVEEPQLGDMLDIQFEDEADMSAQTEQISIEPEVNKPVYQEPVTQAKPKPIAKSKGTSTKGRVPSRKEELKRNQIELNFDDSQSEREKVEIETEVIVLSIVMPENYLMSGAGLLPSLLTLGMKFGEMNIFHRHQDNAGNGKVTFSLANMVNPGTFDLDNMENFTTQGVSLFMTLPNAGDPFEVFEQMLSAAKQLAQEFNGQVLDDKRSVMTKQTEQHYISKIREFERKSRIASA